MGEVGEGEGGGIDASCRRPQEERRDDLRDTFPDSMSRASHVRSAREPVGARLRMAHTWGRTERAEVRGQRG